VRIGLKEVSNPPQHGPTLRAEGSERRLARIRLETRLAVALLNNAQHSEATYCPGPTAAIAAAQIYRIGVGPGI
jgi:hypothetical protein